MFGLSKIARTRAGLDTFLLCCWSDGFHPGSWRCCPLVLMSLKKTEGVLRGGRGMAATEVFLFFFSFLKHGKHRELRCTPEKDNLLSKMPGIITLPSFLGPQASGKDFSKTLPPGFPPHFLSCWMSLPSLVALSVWLLRSRPWVCRMCCGN